jgi:hypothetical protein
MAMPSSPYTLVLDRIFKLHARNVSAVVCLESDIDHILESRHAMDRNGVANRLRRRLCLSADVPLSPM